MGLPSATHCAQLRAAERLMTRIFPLAIAALIAPSWCAAAPCPGNLQALGTERIIAIDAKGTPRVGRKQFPSTLPLGAKELVLTFDDGPWEEMRPHIPSWPGGCCRKVTPSGIIAIRIHLSARCQLRKQRLKLIAASWPMSWPFTAKDAPSRQRPFFDFPASPPTGLSSLA